MAHHPALGQGCTTHSAGGDFHLKFWSITVVSLGFDCYLHLTIILATLPEPFAIIVENLAAQQWGWS